jgi:hypothetical protein
MEKKISKEEWVELSKKLRDRVSAYFNPEQLEAIDEFIRLAGQGSSFDQVIQFVA